MISWKRLTKPECEPVSVPELRNHMRVDTKDEDSIMKTYIKAATDYVESVTSRALITQSWRIKIDEFEDNIYLPKTPVQSVTAIKYFDDDDVEQTLSTSVYSLDDTSDPEQIVLNLSQSWPSISSRHNPIDIEVMVGYGDDASDVPAAIKQAILLVAGHMYEHREAIAMGQVTPMPYSIEALLAPYKAMRFFSGAE